jgi:hypothetical protein
MDEASRQALATRCRQLVSDWLKGLDVGPRTVSEAVGEELGISTAVDACRCAELVGGVRALWGPGRRPVLAA